MEPRNAETCLLFELVVDAGKLLSDQTGCFTVTYKRKVKYIFILYSHDANTICQSPPREELARKSYTHTQHVMTALRRRD